MKASWTEMALGELVEPVETVDPRDEFGEEPFTYVDLSAVDRDQKRITTSTRLTADDAPSRARQLLKRGDVLVSTVRPNLNAVAMADDEHDGAVGSTGFTVLRPNGALDGRYLFHWVRTRGFVASLVRKATGASYPAVSDRIVKAERIPLPPLDEQRRIADILDRLDRLRAQRRVAITQVDSLSRSIFLDMFGDPRSNSYGWAVHKIADVVRDFRGGANLAPDDFASSGFPVLHKGAIKKNGQIAIDPKKKTFARDACAAANQGSQVDRSFAAVTLRDLVPTGPTIGLVADLRHGPSDRYLLAQGVYGFHTDDHAVISEYLVALSNMPTFRHVLRQNAVGSTQIHIRTPVYLSIEIPTPPLATQLEFARRVSGLRQVGRTQAASLDELDALFASVQYRAFDGAL